MHIIKKNKRAQFDYFLLEKYNAGIILTGKEVKAIKAGHIVIDESYVRMQKDQMYLWNAVISSSIYPDIDIDREKKLLLHKKEILEIQRSLQQKGLTVIPTIIGIDHGLVKVEIAVAKGKKRFDKRETIKQREAQREIRRSALEKYR